MACKICNYNIYFEILKCYNRSHEIIISIFKDLLIYFQHLLSRIIYISVYSNVTILYMQK